MVDEIRHDSVQEARSASPSEKAAQALEAMRVGIRLKWAGLRERFPDANEAQLRQRLEHWLIHDTE